MQSRLLARLVNQNQDSINCSGATLEVGTRHLAEPFGYGMLNIVIDRVCNFETRMPVDSINHIPTTVDRVCVTDTVRGHDVVQRPLSSEPTQGTGKSNFWQDSSIWEVVP